MSSDYGGEADFFTEIEQRFNLKIPLFIRNILKINGMDNLKSFENFAEADIVTLENFVRDDLKELIDDSAQLSDYYGVYEKNTDKFKFLVGYRKLLLAIGKFANEQQTRTCFKKTDLRAVRPSNKSVQKPSNSAETEADVVTAVDLTLHNKSISTLLNSWFKSTLEKKGLNSEITQQLIGQFRDINYHCKVDGKDIACPINCCFCENRIMVRQINKSGKLYWSLSNFHAHVIKHIESLQKSEQKPLLKSGRPRLEQGNLNNFGFSISSNLKSQPPPISNSLVSTETEPQTPSQTPLIQTNPSLIEDTLETTIEVSEESGSEVESSKTSKKRLRQLSDPSESSEQDFDLGGTIGVNSPDASESLPLALPVPSQSQLRSKWLKEKYSRRERSRRQREKFNDNSQPLITNYFQQLDDITKLLTENQELKSMLVEETNKICKTEKQLKLESLDLFLKCLVDTAILNSKIRGKNKTTHGNKFEPQFKEFCLYLYLVGGRLLYETLQANIKTAFPSITTLLRSIEKKTVEEGILRFEELNFFLEKRCLPKIVWISEDATKITEKIEYNAKNNKLVGFVIPQVDGVSDKNAFLATSAKSIQNHFLTGTKADYAYIIMAQPVKNDCPAFCLSVFGTDNRFTSTDISSKWKRIKKEANNFGITVLGFSSDGDSRLMKTMKEASLLQNVGNNLQWEWFQMNLMDGELCVQDTVHIGTKLRTRLLNEKAEIKMGNYIASKTHLADLIENTSKDKHGLTYSDINGEDKMNFRSVEKICNIAVSRCLEQNSEAKGTIIYLKIMRSVLEGFLNKEVKLLDRIYFMWYCVFFLRNWRGWLKDSDNLSTTSNFITLNAYLCIELNAHALVKFIRKRRDDPYLKDIDSATWLLSSQPCEQLFRAARSLTSTFSTIINFSMKAIMARINRIEIISKITSQLSESFIFPRNKTSRLGANKPQTQQENFPSDMDIEDACMKALKDASKDCEILGIEADIVNNIYWKLIITRTSKSNSDDIFYNEDDTDEGLILNVANSSTETNIALDRTDDDHTINEDSDIEESDPGSQIIEDATLLDFSEVNLKDHKLKNLSETSPFVYVNTYNKGLITIRKSSLCWLLREQTNRVSTDRLHRFRRGIRGASGQTSKQHENISDNIHIENIENEKYYAVYYSDTWYLGKVMQRQPDEFFKIKFLKSSLSDFFWPKNDDVQEVQKQFIFFGPVKMIGTYPMTLSTQDRSEIVSKYKELKRIYQ